MNKSDAINNFIGFDFFEDFKPKSTLQDNEIRIFGEIWERSFQQLDEAITEAGSEQDLEFLINSVGGSVFDGVAMSALIKRHEGKTVGTGIGLVASIASIILLSTEKVRLNRDAFLMIHNASIGFTYGESEDLRKDADLLDKISNQLSEVYVAQIAKNGKLIEGDRDKTRKRIKKLMNATTWFTAEEALEMGLIDEITDIEADIEPLNKEEINKILNKYGENAPKAFLNKFVMKDNVNNEANQDENNETSFVSWLKNLFKNDPAKVEEVKNEVETEQAAADEAKLEEAKKLLQEAGFAILTQEEVDEINNNLVTETGKAQEANDKFEVLQEEYDDIMNKLREFEKQFNGQSGKTDLDNNDEQPEEKTDREKLLEKYANESDFSNSKFFKSLNK